LQRALDDRGSAFGVRGADHSKAPGGYSLTRLAPNAQRRTPNARKLIVATLAGFSLAIAVAIVSVRARWLARTGALAAVVVGTAAAAAGWQWCVVLLAFFASASLLSSWRRRSKGEATADVIGPSGPRDAGQVLANGGVFAAMAVLHVLHADPVWRVLAFGALAAATADTWATEVGSAIGGIPRSLRGWRRVPPGTSGAVTTAGSLALVAGALFLAALCAGSGVPTASVFSVAAGGVAGGLVDSALGATIQEVRWCPRCLRETERHLHSCGIETEPRRGWSWLGNDGVNLTSTIAGAAISLICWRAWS
jgi:uncharacterized protein (TIGR00297 family)